MSSAAKWAPGSGKSLLTRASGVAESGCAVMGVPVHVGLGKGDVELEALGCVSAIVDLGPSVESAHDAVIGMWYQESHAHPALRQGLVYRIHQCTNIQLCAYQHGVGVRCGEPPPTFLSYEVCFVEAEHRLLWRALRAILGDLGESLLQSVLDGPNLLCKLLAAGVGTQQDNLRIAGGLERAREGIDKLGGELPYKPHRVGQNKVRPGHRPVVAAVTLARRASHKPRRGFEGLKEAVSGRAAFSAKRVEDSGLASVSVANEGNTRGPFLFEAGTPYLAGGLLVFQPLPDAFHAVSDHPAVVLELLLAGPSGGNSAAS